MSSIGQQAPGSYEKEDKGSFTLFPLFPVELRLKIWKLALHCPRVIKIRSDDTREYCTDGLGQPVYRAKATAKHPSLLQVNAESRAVALEVYKAMFAANFQGRPIYFDPDVDILYVKNIDAMLSFLFSGMPHSPDDMTSKIQHLIVGGPPDYVNFMYLPWFRGLSTIILQQPHSSTTSLESSRIYPWGDLCGFWKERWGEAVGIPDVQFLYRGEIKYLVKKRVLKYTDLELSGVYTNKGIGIQEQDMEERGMVMGLAMESNYRFG
jgi:hypothetical protein